MATDLERLGRAVKLVQHRQHRALDLRLREHGSTVAQWDALRAIDARPSASGHELAQATFMSDQAFGTLAARLEAKGLIERRAGRGRRLEHVLTDAGEALLREGTAAAREALAAAFAPLPEERRVELLALLEAVAGEVAAPRG